jgi:uncharacterized membrane protein
MKDRGGSAAKSAWLLCGLAVLAGTLLRLEARRLLHIDETVSLLAAACNQREYARLRAEMAAPFVHWVPASVWQSFLVPRHFACLSEISRGLTETDMHPPLYFWLLHFWLYLVPAGLAAGPSLNAVFALATGVVLLLLGKELFGQPLLAAFAVLAWAVNPSGVEVTHYARPYELLGLVSVLLAWRCVRWVHTAPAREQRLRDASLLFAVSLAGLLTQYSFIFVAAAAGVYLLLALGPKRALVPGATIGLGLVATNVLHPTFHQMLFGHHERAAFSARAGALRASLKTLLRFFSFDCDAPNAPHPGHAWAATLVLLAIVAATAWLALRRPRAETREVDLWFLVVPALSVALVAAGMLLGLLPVHATHPRYFAHLWPFFGLLMAYPLALARPSARTARFIVAGASAALCTAAALSLPAWTNPWPSERTPWSECDRVVVPGSRRTAVFRVALHLDPHVLMFAGGPSDVDQALAREPLDDVCVERGEERSGVLRVLAKRHVTVSGDAHHRRRPHSKSHAREQSEEAEGED